MDYVGIQLPDIESQLSSISLDETRILLNRLYAAGLIYNVLKADSELNLSNWTGEIPVKVKVGNSATVVYVNTTINYFKGIYDAEGFLNYGVGNLTTRIVGFQLIYGTIYVTQSEPIAYSFELSSQTVNLTDITQYTGASSMVVAITALAVVVKKDKELAVVGEESETFWRRFEPII
jgi:hypothetical protein